MSSRLIILFFLFLRIAFYSQTGRISGTIVDSKSGEVLIGATILVEGTNKGSAADLDGKFAINNVPAGKVNLIVNFISYTTKKITDVIVKDKDVTEITITLDESSQTDLGEVTIVATLNKETTGALILQQKNSSSLSDGISAETIKRTPDRNTSDVLKRVSGVTIQDDKYVVIRGLNERYNAAYLNSSPLPSTEPDSKAFSFDLFPANMLDNLVINKTATPDMPGEFAGGIVQINTKSIPEKNFISLSTGIGYNTITTGKTKIIYPGGKKDWLGIDDGSRDVPKNVPSLSEYKKDWTSNVKQAEIASYFPNDWSYSFSKFKPNNNFQLASGYNFKRKEKDFFGIIFSLSNNTTETQFTRSRTEYESLLISNNIAANVKKENEFFNKTYQTQTSTGALLNLSCKINENNQISLRNMFTGFADNKFIVSDGENTGDAGDRVTRFTTRFFTSNQIRSSQLNGENFIPKAKIKLIWNSGYSNVIRTAPGMRSSAYSKSKMHDASNDNPKDTVFMADIALGQNTGPNYSGYRVSSKLNETIINGKLDASRLFKINEKMKLEVKVGTLYQDRKRQFDRRQMGFNPFSSGSKTFDTDLLYLTDDKMFASENMSITPKGLGGFKYTEITHDDDNYKASSTLFANYLMSELKITEKWRFIAGVRAENYHQEVHVNYGKIDSTIVKSTLLDILPSANIIYNINEKFGIRSAVYRTLNRAEFRELAVTNIYDPENRLSIAGNADLQRCYINNADLRFEIYPGKSQLFTVTGFYKYFNTPIERYMLSFSENQIYYRNANFANVYGAELEYRVNVGAILKADSIRFLQNLNLFSNLSLIKSAVNVKGLNDKVPDVRTMQGQAPYIINAGISYTDNKYNYSFTTMLNRVGEKIYIVGNDQVPNRWENSRTVLDLQVTKSFFKNRLELKFNIKDLLHTDYVIYYKGTNRASNVFDPKNDYTNFRRNYGSVYTFNVSYKF